MAGQVIHSSLRGRVNLIRVSAASRAEGATGGMLAVITGALEPGKGPGGGKCEDLFSKTCVRKFAD